MKTNPSIIENYVNEICSYVKFKKAHQEIKLELMDHLEEKLAEEISLGVPEDKAMENAISQMGQVELIGKQLNETHKSTPEWGVLIVTILFSALGLIISFLIQNKGIGEGWSYFYKSISFYILGYIIIILLYLFDYRKLENYSKQIYIALTLVLILASLINQPRNGRSAWMTLPFIGVDVTEISLFLYAISLAKIIKTLKWENIKQVICGFILLGLPLILYIKLISLNVAVTYFIVFIALMFFAKARKRYIFSMIGVTLAGAVYYVNSETYHLNRIAAFLHPEKSMQGAGWIYLQLAKIIKAAGYFGQGFTFPVRIIPEIQTDFILVYIIYTFGWVMAIGIVAVVIVFISRMFLASRKIKNDFGSLIIKSFMCIFAIEFLWNILMIFGLAPITYIGLPFVSYGGSHVVTQMAAIGIIISIYKAKSLTMEVETHDVKSKLSQLKILLERYSSL